MRLPGIRIRRPFSSASSSSEELWTASRSMAVSSSAVAVGLLAMNVWGLYEYLGLARRRAWALVGGTLAVGAGIVLWLRLAPGSANAVYTVMAGAFAYCAWLALRFAPLDGPFSPRALAFTAAFIAAIGHVWPL